jgi:hypothetical protein
MKNVAVRGLMVFVILVGLCAAQTFKPTESNAQIEESVPSLAHLTKFVGKYPSGGPDDNRVKGKNLIDDQAFRQVLMKTLGNKRFNIFMSDLNVEVPIKQKGQIIYFRKGMPHNYAFLRAHIFINLSDNSIEAYWHSTADKQDYWLSSKKKPRIIQELRENDLAMFEKYGNQ